MPIIKYDDVDQPSNFNNAMGESECLLTVKDVGVILNTKFAYLSGGKCVKGRTVVTFPDSPPESITETDYQRLIQYLTSIPSLQEVDAGFVLIIDRRKSNWTTIKTILHWIAGSFPGVIYAVFVLIPSSFLQKHLTTLNFKLLNEDFKFPIHTFTQAKDLHKYFQLSELTEEFSGTLEYSHNEWVEQRTAVEEFCGETRRVLDEVRSLVARLGTDSDTPNDASSSRDTAAAHRADAASTRSRLTLALGQGRALLACFRSAGAAARLLAEPQLRDVINDKHVNCDVTNSVSAYDVRAAQTSDVTSSLSAFDVTSHEPSLLPDAASVQMTIPEFIASAGAVQSQDKSSAERSIPGDGEAERKPCSCDHIYSSSQLSASRRAHITAVERLLVQLEQTEKNFDVFWEQHDARLQQCLQLRQFEEEFRQVQYEIGKHLAWLSKDSEDAGDSLRCVDEMIDKFNTFKNNSREDLERASELRLQGERFISEEYYAVDCIRPKCTEIRRLSERYAELCTRRYEFLQKARALHERLHKANKWCIDGMNLLASHPADPGSMIADAQHTLHQITDLLRACAELKLGNPREFHSLFDSIMNADIRALVKETLQKMEDVKEMCDKRQSSLRLIIAMAPRQNRLAHAAAPNQTTGGSSGSHTASSRSGAANSSVSSTDMPVQRRRRNSSSSKKRRSLSADQLKERVSALRGDRTDGSDSSGSTEESNPSRYSTSPLRVVLPEPYQAKQGHVMNELINTERHYVAELNDILTGYVAEMDSPSAKEILPPELQDSKSVLFGNLDKIHEFHKNIFLKELEDCQHTPALVGHCFTERKDEFQMYSAYCQNKLASDELRRRVGTNHVFFKECQRRLNHKLPLDAYLLKPVQRITKYQLLLKSMYECRENEKGAPDLQSAIDSMLQVLKHLNDIMHQVAITGFTGNLSQCGRLLMQGSFNCWSEHKKDKLPRGMRFKPMQRHIFLYEKVLIFCKKKEDMQHADKEAYIYKHSLETSEIGLTETVKNDSKKFELWLHGKNEVYTIQAPDHNTKKLWLDEIKKVLMCQFDALRETNKRHVELIDPTQRLHHGNMEKSNSFETPQNTVTAASDKNDTMISSSSMSDTSSLKLGSQADSVEDDGWETEDWDNNSEDSTSTNTKCLEMQEFVALEDYNSAAPSEISLSEGERVRLIRHSNDTWWLVRSCTTGRSGWAPSSYLDVPSKRGSALSVVSLSSAESGIGSSLRVPVTVSNQSNNESDIKPVTVSAEASVRAGESTV